MPAPNFSYDERSGRYRDLSTGRYVAMDVVRAEGLERVIAASQDNITAISERLANGQITLAEWQNGMVSEIRTINGVSAVAARGGMAQMTFADWGREGALVKAQYQYLQNFANEIASGKQPLNGRFMARAKLYASAARGTFAQIRRKALQTRGFTEERRNLHPAEHCTGCLAQSELGWQPIGTLDPIGAEECKVNCQCTFRYRGIGPNGRYVYAEG